MTDERSAATQVSGRQIDLRAGKYVASIASVGASLRSLTFDGRHLVIPFAADQVRPAYRGATLAPWPNRVVDGRYTFDAAGYELALTEPRRGHALHGLLVWADWAVIEQSETSVRLAAEIVPQAGYPWRVRVETTYSLDDSGLRQEITGENLSDSAAPFGVGGHPYLTPGNGTLDEATLTIPANAVLHVTEDRLIPTAIAAVDADPVNFDFRQPRAIGAVALDHAFTDLIDDDGCFVSQLVDVDGDGVQISWDARSPWLQVHTADLPEGESDAWHRAGLAVEPMTCPPDAFNSDHELVRLAPGESRSAGWTIAAVTQV